MVTRARLHLGRARLALVLALWAGQAYARNPPIVGDPREGVWLGAGELFVYQSNDKWSVFPAGATVNKLATDGTVVWIATDDGAIKLDSGSRGATRFGIEDGLPSQVITSIAVDERFVWFATNKGLARYRKLDRTWRIFTEADGLPHRAVNDILVIGRQVWLATRGGLALYDTDVDGVRGFGGAAGDDLVELFLVGEDLFCRTDAGLSRFRPRTRTFSNFSFAEMGATELRAWVIDGGQLWLGTDNGLVSFQTTSDTFLPFPQQSSLASRSIRGLELLSDYLFITTDAEVVQFHKVNKSFQRYTVADGLTMHPSVVGSLLSGGVFTVLFGDGAATYVVARDVWTSRSLETTQAEKATKARFFGRGNASVPYDAVSRSLDEQRFSTAEGGFGFSHRFDPRRSLDVSGRLNYGQLELPGIREVTARVDYQGAPDDTLRELRAEDSYKYQTREEGLDRPLVLRGGEMKLAADGNGPNSTATGGLRRGTAVRDFINGAKQSVVPLSHRYILPGSERVRVDGELLTNGTDYTVIYPAGQLAFLDLERVDELSVIEVEYEVDLQPRKGLGVLSLLDLLPADREVGDWTRSGEARMISDETSLYAQIDGAAPRYLDRGWMKSVFVEYRQGGRTVTVSIHDLGTDANARTLYDVDLPPAREAVEGRPNVVLDLGLATSYAVKAVLGTYYLELAIDEKSDAARQSIKLFAIQILDRSTGAGANIPGETPEWLVAWRVAQKPVEGLETGLRFVKVVGTGTTGPNRNFLTTMGDARYEHSVGKDGLLTGYAELGGSLGQGTLAEDGYAALGSLRLAHPLLDGTLSLRHQSEGFTQLGSSATRFGHLADEGRAQLTAYPEKWLPTTAFFSRSWSYTSDGSPGIEQHALARVQLSREGLPNASLQVGHSLLDGASSRTGRLKGVAQLDYDLAQGILSFLKMKRFVVRGLYSFSQADVSEAGVGRNDQVKLLRLETRIAPTATESVWALFRSHELDRRAEGVEAFAPALSHWELNAGARSAIIPGLIPQLTYAAAYTDDQVTQPNVSARAAQGNIAATLTIQPGRWAPALAALMVEPRFSVVNDEKAEGIRRTGRQRTNRLDNRIIWAGGGKVDVELIQVLEAGLTGKDFSLTTRKLDLRNRLVFRPVVTNPFTLRGNYSQQESANDPTVLPGAPALGKQSNWEGVLEWLRRWNTLFTTRLRAVYGGGTTSDLVQRDSTGTAPFLASFLQHRVGSELELRFTRTTDASNLFLVQRDTVYRHFGTGLGATQAVTFSGALGIVLALGDKLYLDAEVAWLQTVCLDSSCAISRRLQPRALLTLDL